MAISSLGVGSGLDLSSIITSLMQVEQQPLLALQKKEASYQSRISALGGLKSTLSSLQTAAANLVPDSTTSASQKFTSLKTSTGDTTIATATAGTGALASNYTLKNINLAAAEQIRKTEGTLGIPGSGTGTLSIKVGTGTAVDISVTGGSSLSDIAKAINDAKSDVSASVINDGTTNHLVISAKKTGASNTISITGSVGWEGFNFKPTSTPLSTNAWTQQQNAASASVDINGLTVTSDSNTITTAISGLTINLLKESSSGTTLSVSQDSTTSITAALNSFIKAYNDAASSMKSLGAYNETTKVAGALQGDATLRGAQNRIFNLLTSKQGTGDYTILADIGVALQKDGTLKLDSGKLNKAIESDFSAVANLTASVGTAFKTGLESLIGSSGNITSMTESATRMIKELSRRQEALQTRLAQVQERYTKQFSALDTLIANMNQTSSSLTQMLANLPGSSSSSDK